MQSTSIRRVVFGSLFALGLLGASTAAVTPQAAHAGERDGAGLRATVTGTLQQPPGPRVRDHRTSPHNNLDPYGCNVTMAQGGVAVSLNTHAAVQICPR
jgi:hypothetical protein